MNDNSEDEINYEAAAAALKVQYDIDRAEVGANSVTHLVYRGVKIHSRFGVIGEFNKLRRIVDAMEDLIRARIQEICVDSRARAFYEVTIAPGKRFGGIDLRIERAFDGYNGLIIKDDQGQIADFDPKWGKDFD